MGDTNNNIKDLALKIEAKRKHVCSSRDLSEQEWTVIDTYNAAMTEAAEIVRASLNASRQPCEWIYTKSIYTEDRLPKNGEYFVTITLGSQKEVVQATYDDGIWRDKDGALDFDWEVIAYMPVVFPAPATSLTEDE